MHLFRQEALTILWGDKEVCSLSKNDQLFSQFCHTLADNLGLNGLTVLDQNHGTQGICVDKREVSVYDRSGDWLVTKEEGVGIMSLSADCLPIVFFDVENQAIGIAHSGWRGTVKSIATVVVRCMQERFSTKTNRLQVFFGPNARVCCYEVSVDFVQHIPEKYKDSEVLVKRETQYFFDNTKLSRLILKECGIVAEQINEQNNKCTMCDDSFYSARRDKGLQRNVTVAFLDYSVPK